MIALGKAKRHSRNGRKIFANHIHGKGLVSRIYIRMLTTQK